MSRAKNPSIAVLKRDNGAEKIGYGASTVKGGLDAVKSDVEKALRKPLEPVNFGVTPDSDDNTAAWQALLDQKPAHIHFSVPGTYTFLGQATHDTDVAITAAPGVIIDCSGVGFVGGYWTKFAGAMPQIENLGVDASKGARVVTFASPPSLSPGDVFVIYNPTTFSWSAFRSNYFAGEFCRVVAVSGNDVTVAGELYDGYAAASVDVYRLDGIRVAAGGFEIKGDVSASLINLEFCRDSWINNVKGHHKNNSVIALTRCFNTVITDPAIHNEGDGGDDYGISIANSQTIKVSGGDVYSRRHAVTTGGDAQVGAVPCRDIRITNMTLSNDIGAGTHCADFHGNTEDSTYENCEIYGGATWQGKNNGYVNCRIGALSIGVCILAAEIKGGTHYARGCGLVTFTDPDISGRGVVEVGGNGGGITSNTSEDANFQVIGGSLNGRNLSATTRLVYVRNRGTTHKVSAEVSGVDLDVNDFGEVLLVLLSTGAADSNGFIVDNLKSVGPKQGGKLATITAAYSGFPMKMQKQTGFEEVTTSTGAPSIAGTPVTFRWEYPKTPALTISRNNRGYAGNRIGTAYAQPLSASAMTPSIATDDGANFSSAVTVQLHWHAEIAEV